MRTSNIKKWPTPVPPQAKTAAEIEAETQSTNNEFAKLKAEYDTVNDAATEQTKQTEKTDLVHDIIDGKEPFSKSTYWGHLNWRWSFFQET